MNEDSNLLGDGANTTPQTQPTKRLSVAWAGILVSYAILFSVTGYIAFFQEPYNPASNPSERFLTALGNEAVDDVLLDVLKEESAAFKARRDLAAQSFNVVLGALLGFLSASSVAASLPGKQET